MTMDGRWRVVVLVLVVAAAGCRSQAHSTAGPGDPQSDMVKLRLVADETAKSAGIIIDNKISDEPGWCQRESDGSSGTAAKIVYAMSLNGANSVDVAERISELWRREDRTWFGEGMTIEAKSASPQARVHLYGKGWTIRAEVPLNEERGPYALIADGPCY